MRLGPAKGGGPPSWGRVKVTPVYWSQFWTESARALGWSAPVGASIPDTPAWCSLRERRLPRRIPRPYGQCRRAAFPRSSRPGSSRRRSSNSLNCRRYKIIDTCCCTETVHTYGYRQGRVTQGEAAAHVTGTQRRDRSRTGARNLATTPAREVVKAFPGAVLKTRM